MGCLYQITFPNGKSYIGITRKTAEQRFATHRYQSKGKRAYAICEAFRAHGADNAVVTTLVIGDYDFLATLEPAAIAAFGTKAPYGYNMTDGGEVPVGLTADSLAKIGAGHTPGKPRHTTAHSAESRAMMSTLKKGKPLSSTHRANISRALVGNSYSKGRVLSPQHKAAISTANTGKVITEETRARMRFAATAREDRRRRLRGAT